MKKYCYFGIQYFILHRFSVFNRDNFVRALDCPQPVGDYEDGFALDEF